MSFSGGFYNVAAAWRARFWSRVPGGGALAAGALKPPVDYTIDNLFQDYAFDSKGNTIKFVSPADSLNRTALNNPNGVSVHTIQSLQIAAPSAPTVTNVGTAGTTTVSYKLVGLQGAGGALTATTASSAGTTTTANATLDGTNYNQLTFTPASGLSAYLIYRTAAGGTPSTTGIIGLVYVNVAPNGTLTPITFNDTGIAADGTSVFAVNSTGISQFPIYGDITTLSLTTPVNVTGVANGTTGTNSAYKIVANSQNGHTAASSAVTISGAGTLTAVNSNTITWNAVPGALSYDVYRTTAPGTPSTTGKIGNVTLAQMSASGTFSFTDTGLAGDSASAPTVNTTGTVTANGGYNFIATETGANNALVVSLPGVSLVAGLQISVVLGHTLQAGTNTINLNGAGPKNIKSHFNTANNIATAYAVGAIWTGTYDGTQFQDNSQ